MRGRELQMALNRLEYQAQDLGLRVIPFEPRFTDYTLFRNNRSWAAVSWAIETRSWPWAEPLFRLVPWVIAYDRNHPHALYGLAHEMGHILHLRAEPEVGALLNANEDRLPLSIILWAEEQAWDIAEAILRRHAPGFDVKHFRSVRGECVDSYRRSVPVRKTGAPTLEAA